MFLLSEIVVKLFFGEKFMPASIVLNHEETGQCVVFGEWIFGAANVLQYILCLLGALR